MEMKINELVDRVQYRPGSAFASLIHVSNYFIQIFTNKYKMQTETCN